jgi:citrate synthase
MATRTSGMEGVIAGDSAITWIDGEKGELRYRGYSIGDLAERCSFEDVAYLLWYGDLPSPTQRDTFRAELHALRTRWSALGGEASSLPLNAHPLDILRYLVSRDALTNPLVADNSFEANVQKSKEFTAWFPIVVAAYHRARHGNDSVAPPDDSDTATAFLTMLHGKRPSSQAVATLNMSLVLHADHELNASTFAARVTIATQSNLHAAVASALGTLAGPRHGGASDRVIQMMEDIGKPDRAESWALERLGRHERIMGFGHRVYRTVDPRSRHLRRMAQGLVAGGPHEPWIEILDVLAGVMQRERSLYPNVDLFAAIVNHELGIDPAFYTAIFACSRIVGWTAHSIEQLDGRMIRPVAEYVGPAPREVPAMSLQD